MPDGGFYLFLSLLCFFFFNRLRGYNRDSNVVCFIAHLYDTLMVVEGSGVFI